MTYTNHTAGMTLASARDIIARPEAGWTADQTARARAVVNHWARIQKNRVKKTTLEENRNPPGLQRRPFIGQQPLTLD